MAAATTINGKPNLFISPETPTEILPTYRVRVKTFAEIAAEMATESVIDSEAEMLNDPEFQAEYNEYCEKLEQEWRNDPEAQAAFEKWCDAEERQVSELETAEAEAHDAHLEAQAEAHDLANGGEAYLIGANTNHDAIWQAGGQV